MTHPHRPSIPLPSLETVAERLSYARRLSGLTQSQAAETLGRSRGVIVELESGKREPAAIYLRALADLYGVPLAWLEMQSGDHSRTARRSAAEVRAALALDSVRADDWFVDLSTYDAVMGAKSAGDLPAAVLDDVVTIAVPVASVRPVPWREAQRMQDGVRDRVRSLREGSGH